MTDFANLVIAVDSRQTAGAAGSLDTLTAAGGRAQRSAEQLAVASKGAGRGVNEAGLEYVRASSAAGQLRLAQLGAVGSAEKLALANVRVGNSAGQQRAGFQQLGFQINDFTTQVSSGTSVMQALAQQLGQTTQALQLMGGGPGSALGRVAGFLGGPWGLALSIGAIALVPLIGKLFDGKDAADDFTKSLLGATDQAGRLADSIKTVQGLRKIDLDTHVNNLRIDLNSKTEEQSQLELLVARRPYARDPNAKGIFGGGAPIGGARQRLREVLQEILALRDLIRVGEEGIRAAESAATTATTATTANTAAIRSSGAAHAARTPAISAGQRAIDQATKSTADYIARLEQEIAKMGKTETQLRAMDVARAREGAATEAQRQRIDELNAAREREIGRGKIGATVLADLAERRKALEGAFERASKNREEGLRREKEAADEYRNTIESLIGALDQIGGRKLGNVAAIVGGLATGDFRGARGQVGGLLNAVSQSDSGKSALAGIATKLDDIFGGTGTFTKTVKGALEGAGIGIAAGNLVLGGKGSKAGAGIGGAFGEAVFKKLAPELFKKLGAFAGPLGAIAGGILGGVVGGLLKKTKSGSATLGFTNGELGVTGTGGNSASRQSQASGFGDNISGALGSIAERLGGKLDGPISVSIGIRDKNIRVDPTGAGNTKKSKGAVDFGQDQAAAIKFAIADAIKDGAITGLSAGVAALLKGGTDIEKQLSKALKFQSVFDELKQRTDPFGFAMQQLSREAEGLKKIFAEAGASAQDYAQLEQVLAFKREAAAKDQANASKALKDFLLDLNAGPGSPLSLRQQRSEAEAALAPFSAAIASAQAARAQADSLRASGGSADAISAAEQAARVASGKIDQSGFQSAANRLLGISRASDASGAGFFADFDRIRALTSTGIGLIDSAATADLTPQIAQNTADTAALLVDNNELQKAILAQLQAMNDNGAMPGNWLDQSRGFA